MTYSEYRNQFKTVEEFRHAFGELTEEEARALISAENSSTMVKAAMMTTWRMSKKEVSDKDEALRFQNPAASRSGAAGR